MLSKKIKKFKTMKLVSEFAAGLLVFAYLIFLLLTQVNIAAITDEIVLRFIFSGFSLLISAFAFIKIMDYMSKSKILNFNKYFNREEVMNNIGLFKQQELNGELISFFKENNDLIQGNIKVITENINNREWIIELDLNTEQKKILLLDKDLDWYSRQVSSRKLCLYLKEEINDIIEKEQSEYYIVIINLFSDFLSEESLIKMKNVINIEQKTLIINI